MQTIRIKIESELHAEYAWTLLVFSKYIGFNFELVDTGEDVLIAEHGMGDIQISHFFRNTYQSGNYQFKSYFRKEPLHFSSSGKADYLSTCFYLLSYLQEYIDYVPDKYDRFPFALSLQNHFNCVDDNLVSKYFDALYKATPKLKSLVEKQTHKSKFFLSHDIDSAHGALGDNGKYLLKHGKIGTLLHLIFNHYLRTPDYLLLGKIMDMEDAHDVKSTFFWLAKQGRGNRRIHNADYDINAKKIVDQRKQIHERGFINGLHKAVSDLSYADELKRMGDDAFPINRNHYLRLSLPESFDEMESSNIKMDASMGFAEAIGFRNNYGLPFQPFNLKEKRAYEFTEVPLTIMDSTLKFYSNKNSTEAKKEIFSFLEKHKENALISILWHNNYFFDYTDKGWVECYKSILTFIKENNFEVVTPEKLLIEFQ
jgi:hypothetical protein